jgi:hypothetical protein
MGNWELALVPKARNRSLELEAFHDSTMASGTGSHAVLSVGRQALQNFWWKYLTEV